MLVYALIIVTQSFLAIIIIIVGLYVLVCSMFWMVVQAEREDHEGKLEQKFAHQC